MMIKLHFAFPSASKLQSSNLDMAFSHHPQQTALFSRNMAQGVYVIIAIILSKSNDFMYQFPFFKKIQR
jgi:hypothetical protein